MAFTTDDIGIYSAMAEHLDSPRLPPNPRKSPGYLFSVYSISSLLGPVKQFKDLPLDAENEAESLAPLVLPSSNGLINFPNNGKSLRYVVEHTK